MSDVLASNPVALGTKADSYIRSAQAILEAAGELENLVFDQRSRSTDAVGTAAREVARGLHAAHGRYNGTASALKTYSVELARIQQNYRTAQEEAATADAAGARADYEIGRLERTIKINEDNGASPQAIERLELDLQGWQRRANSSNGAVENAQELIGVAASQFEEAAQRAISAIDTAIAEGKDSIWDHLRKFVEDIYATFVSIAQWAAGVLKSIVDAIDRFIDAIMPFIVLALITIAAIVLLVGLAGLVTLLLGPGFGLLVLTLGLAAIAIAISTLIIRPLTDILSPTPPIRKHDPKNVVDPDPATLGEVFSEAKFVDAEGGTQESVVKIEKIVAADGSVSYRVILPSTQDWQALAPFMSGEEIEIMKMLEDQGATNDVDSNLALLMFPGLRTQYERAVLDAMEAAGINGGPNGDPVMLVGFSQGGIMAGHLAANRSNEYNFEAIVVCGAPIDHMNIPPKTTVVSFQHVGDPVALADYAVRPDQAAPHQGPNWHTWVEDPPPGADSVDEIHNAANYNKTLNENLDEVEAMDPDLEKFFPGEGDTATQDYYAWNE